MGIKGVLIDVSGTLMDTSAKEPVYAEGMVEFLECLRELDIVPVLVSNDLSQKCIEKLIDGEDSLSGAVGLTSEFVGKKKGSPVWIDKACDLLQVSPNELVYVGDSRYDMITAASRGVIYFHAGWSKPHKEYGLDVPSPAVLQLILKHVFVKEKLWYWSADQADSAGRPLQVRSLIDGNGANIKDLKSDLMTLKSGYDRPLGPITLRQFIILQLIASMYLDGLTTNVGVWCTYPGSAGGGNPLLGPLLDVAAKLFHVKLRPDGIIRHTNVAPKHKMRVQGQTPDFSHEADSAMLLSTPAFKRKVAGKRVVVFDDFTTDGLTAEFSRNWFLNMGAREVIVVSIGKYGNRYHVQVPEAGTDWDSALPNEGLKFKETLISVNSDEGELRDFSDHYVNFLAESVNL